MRRKKEVQQGTLALMVLKTLDVLVPQIGIVTRAAKEVPQAAEERHRRVGESPQFLMRRY